MKVKTEDLSLKCRYNLQSKCKLIHKVASLSAVTQMAVAEAIGVFTIGPLGPCPPPFELRKISHMAKTYNLREVAPVENH